MMRQPRWPSTRLTSRASIEWESPSSKRDRAAGIDLVQARKHAKLEGVVAEGDTFKAII